MVDKPAQKLITRSQFAREAGVSRQAVTKVAATVLKAACSGTFIDVDHPDAIDYIKSKQAPQTKKAATPSAAKPKPAKTRGSKAKKAPTPKAVKSKKPRASKAVKSKPPAPEPESHFSEERNLEPVLDMTLRDIVKKYGTSTQFRAWVDAVDKIESIRNRILKSAAMEGTLISRELVKTHIFGLIESNNLRLLGDMPKTLTRRTEALFKSGASIEDVEGVMRKMLGAHIKGVKAGAKRVLKNA